MDGETEGVEKAGNKEAKEVEDMEEAESIEEIEEAEKYEDYAGVLIAHGSKLPYNREVL